MAQKFEQETQYFHDNHAELMEKYRSKLIAIRGDQVLGVVESFDDQAEFLNAGDVCFMFVSSNEPHYTTGEYTRIDQWTPSSRSCP